MSMCRVFSGDGGRGCLLWPVHSLGRTLLAFALLHSVLQGQICLLLQLFLDFLLCIPVPYNEKDIILGVSSRRSCKFFIEPFNFSFFSIIGWGIGLYYRDIEWFVLEMNRDHSVVFEIASKYCISDSSVDYEGYSTSKGFLWYKLSAFSSLVCSYSHALLSGHSLSFCYVPTSFQFKTHHTMWKPASIRDLAFLGKTN